MNDLSISYSTIALAVFYLTMAMTSVLRLRSANRNILFFSSLKYCYISILAVSVLRVTMFLTVSFHQHYSRMVSVGDHVTMLLVLLPSALNLITFYLIAAIFFSNYKSSKDKEAKVPATLFYLALLLPFLSFSLLIALLYSKIIEVNFVGEAFTEASFLSSLFFLCYFLYLKLFFMVPNENFKFFYALYFVFGVWVTTKLGVSSFTKFHQAEFEHLLESFDLTEESNTEKIKRSVFMVIYYLLSEFLPNFFSLDAVLIKKTSIQEHAPFLRVKL